MMNYKTFQNDSGKNILSSAIGQQIQISGLKAELKTIRFDILTEY